MSEWSDWEDEVIAGAIKVLTDVSSKHHADTDSLLIGESLEGDEASDDDDKPLITYVIQKKTAQAHTDGYISDSSSDDLPLNQLTKSHQDRQKQDIVENVSSLKSESFSESDDPLDPDYKLSDEYETENETELNHVAGEGNDVKKVLHVSEKEHELPQIAQRWHQKRLDILLKARKMKLIPVLKNGDCLLKAIPTAMKNDTLSIADLRNDVYEHLLEHYDHYKAFLPRITNKLLGHWSEDAMDLIPLALANVFHQPINILTSRHARQVINIMPSMYSEDLKQPVTLAYTCIPGREHYDPCVSEESIDSPNESSSCQDSKQQDIAAQIHTTPVKKSSRSNKSCHTQKECRLHQSKAFKLTRKRKSMPDSWKNNVRKQSRLHGKSYVNTCGQQVLQKCQNVKDCSKCLLKCSENVSKEQCAQLFQDFWQLGSYERQRDFIIHNIQEKQTKPSKKKQTKAVHRIFSFLINGERVNVCKGFFLTTLAISEKKMRIALEKKRSRDHTKKDQRGRHDPFNKTPEDQLLKVREHIESFPTVESHYTRKNSTRKYLAADLSIARMYALYRENCTNNETKVLKEHIYRRIFNTEYNLYFFKPKKDQCELCNKYEHQNSGTSDEDLKMKYEQHQIMKEEARKEKETSKEIAKKHKETHAVTFDLQAVLTTPCSLVSQVYYKRKLCSYNLSFYSLGDQNGTCYLWNESHGARGASEISTCLLMYLTSLPSHVRYVTFFSDNCTGQNRNRYVASALHYAVTTIPNLHVVEQKFLETGHTQMECDSMHAAIEHAKRKTSVFEPSQWETRVHFARKTNPYSVEPLNFRQFLDFHEYASSNFRNLVYDTTGSRIKWMKLRVLQVRKESPGMIFVKYDYRDDSFTTINTNRRKQRGRPSDQDMLNFTKPRQKYSSKLPISDKKKKDLLSLCSSGVIPELHHQFYKNLPSSSTVNDRLPQPDAREECEEVKD